MTTYPIHPAPRLMRRLKGILTELLEADAFIGCAIFDESSAEAVERPFISLGIEASEEKPLRSNAWQLQIKVVLVEDRPEANTVLNSGDTRTRHEWRHENISARLFGEWDGERLPEALTGVTDDWTLSCIKMHSQGVAQDSETVDQLVTAWSFTAICAATST